MRIILTCLFLLCCIGLGFPVRAETLVLKNIAYGNDAAQRFDVYAPPQARGAPVIVMVHGGGWRRGDKEMPRVIENKLARWLPKGFVFVTVNYRMLPGADPLTQAGDVARAVALAQEKAAGWGADRHKFILMGHSAGAHLLALLSSRPDLLRENGVGRWLGTVLLDSGALDVPAIMNRRHFPLYDQAFGRDPAYWQAVSPLQQLNQATAPLLAVCSSQRRDSCPEAQRFVAKASQFGTRSAVLPLDLSHGEINALLGQAGNYTTAVEAFMRSLDKGIAQALL
ncbi:MAG: alpha/beta hydrolase [Rhodocyclales bacterium GT-UBC]|nr:MAG: alpha/beta hydrolase [Rhodocyclales bacterium GT-UBC]